MYNMSGSYSNIDIMKYVHKPYDSPNHTTLNIVAPMLDIVHISLTDTMPSAPATVAVFTVLSSCIYT